MTISPLPLADECRLAPQQSASGNFDSASALAYSSALFILGSLSTLITPALVQGWSVQFHWAEARLGWIAMVELAGLASGSVSAFFWQRRYNWRQVSGAAIVAIIAANALCLLTSAFWLLCLMRFACGAGGGVLVGVYTAFLSNTRSPEKFLAATTLTQITTQAALMTLSSSILERWGMEGIYIMLAGAVAILLPALRYLPPGWPSDAAIEVTGERSGGTPGSWPAGLLILAAFIPFEIFQGGTFAFLQEFGQRGASLGTAQTLHVIGFSAVGSGIGPIAAYFLADRAGIIIPLAISLAVMLAIMAGLATGPYSAMSLLLLLSLLQATWLFATCYFYAGLIKINNILTQAASPLSAVSLAAGASLMGMAIELEGLNGILRLSAICLVLAAVAALPPLYLARCGSR